MKGSKEMGAPTSANTVVLVDISSVRDAVKPGLEVDVQNRSVGEFKSVAITSVGDLLNRSEERRVGKECRL